MASVCTEAAGKRGGGWRKSSRYSLVCCAILVEKSVFLQPNCCRNSQGLCRAETREDVVQEPFIPGWTSRGLEMIVEQAFCSVLISPNTIKAIDYSFSTPLNFAGPSHLKDLYGLQICWNKIALCWSTKILPDRMHQVTKLRTKRYRESRNYETLCTEFRGNTIFFSKFKYNLYY